MSNENENPSADLSSWLTPEVDAQVKDLLDIARIKNALSQVQVDSADLKTKVKIGPARGIGREDM